MARPKSAPYFERLRQALDISVERLADISGLELVDVYRLCADGKTNEAEVDADVYNALAGYVNERLGACIALRTSLQHLAHDAVKKRIKDRQRILGNE